VTGLAPLVGLFALIAAGGLFAAIDAAINTVSIARLEELVRNERPGASRLARVLRDRPRYINLVVLLRITCEVSATVLLVAYISDDFGMTWGLVAAAAEYLARRLGGTPPLDPAALPADAAAALAANRGAALAAAARDRRSRGPADSANSARSGR
jgi:hypothetical protein